MKTRQQKSGGPLKLVSDIFAGVFIFSFFLYIFFVADADLFLNSDYLSFLTGAKLVAAGKGTQLYDFSTQLGLQTKIKLSYKDQIRLYPKDKLNNALPYRNLPFVAFFLIPFALLPSFLSFKIFAALNLVLLCFLLWKINRTVLKNSAMDLLVFVSFVFIPVLTSIVRGQLTLVALTLFYLLYINIKKGQSFLSGIIAGFLIIKPQYLFALPFLIYFVPELKKFIKGFLFTMVFLGLLSFMVSGINILEYPKFILMTEQSNYGSVPVEILTIFSVLRRILDSEILAFFLNMLMYFLVLGIFIYYKRSYSLDLAIGIAITSSLLFGVHMTDNEVVLMLLPMLLLIKDLLKKRWVFIFVLLCMIAPLLRFTVFAFWEIAFIVVIEAVLFLNGRNKKQVKLYEKDFY